MTFVVTESCIRCKYTDCVSVCPVDCFREGPNFLVIHPGECIDCGVCVPECPANAIVDAKDLPPDQHAFLQINAELAEVWPPITAQREPMPDADAWRDVQGKREQLIVHGTAHAGVMTSQNLSESV